jgi:hypothetical protein
VADFDIQVFSSTLSVYLIASWSTYVTQEKSEFLDWTSVENAVSLHRFTAVRSYILVLHTSNINKRWINGHTVIDVFGERMDGPFWALETAAPYPELSELRLLPDFALCSRYPLGRRLGGFKSRSGRGDEEKRPMSQESSPSRPARGLVAILTELSRFQTWPWTHSHQNW